MKSNETNDNDVKTSQDPDPIQWNFYSG